MFHDTATLPTSKLFPYTTLFRSDGEGEGIGGHLQIEVGQRVQTHGDEGGDRGAAEKTEVGASPAPRHDRQGDESQGEDRKSTRLNSSHLGISYAVFCLKKKRYRY